MTPKRRIFWGSQEIVPGFWVQMKNFRQVAQQDRGKWFQIKSIDFRVEEEAYVTYARIYLFGAVQPYYADSMVMDFSVSRPPNLPLDVKRVSGELPPL